MTAINNKEEKIRLVGTRNVHVNSLAHTYICSDDVEKSQIQVVISDDIPRPNCEKDADISEIHNRLLGNDEGPIGVQFEDLEEEPEDENEEEEAEEENEDDQMDDDNHNHNHNRSRRKKKKKKKKRKTQLEITASKKSQTG